MEDRIKQVMESLGLSQQEFAQKLELSPASLSNIFNGRSKPTNNHVQAIHRAFPSINTNWLMFGEGNMLEGPEKNISNLPSQNSGGSSGDDSSAPLDFGVGEKGGLSDGSTMSLFSGLAHSPQNNPESQKNGAKTITKIVTEQKIVRPKILEIRVFYDDQTFESFVPSEKRNVSR